MRRDPLPLLVLLTVVGLTLVVLFPPPLLLHTEAAAVAPERLSAIDQVLTPCVRINLPNGGAGSGTVIYTGEYGTFVLTAAHVVVHDPIVDVDVYRYGPVGDLWDVTQVTGYVVACDEGADLAVLRLDPDVEVVAARLLPPAQSIQVLQQVTTVGCPAGRWPAPSEGIIASIFEDTIQATPDVLQGNSGGGLMVRRGDDWFLAGVTSKVLHYHDQFYTHVGYYVPSWEVWGFLHDNFLGFMEESKGGSSPKK